MSENIQPSSEDNQIVEDLSNEESSKKLLEFNNKELITNLKQNRFECRSCGYIYDPIEGNKKLNIPKNTPFSEICLFAKSSTVWLFSEDGWMFSVTI